MADEEVKPVEEVVEVEKEKQEELPLAAETEKKPEAVAEGESKPEPVKEEPKPDWRDKELKAKHRRQKELERTLAEKEAELEAQKALLAKFNQTKTEETPQPEAEIDRRAKEIVAQQAYVEKCNSADSRGKEAYKEQWQDAVGNLELLGGFDPATMNGILATDDPSKVLFELGKNPEKYHQIMALPLERRIIEMDRIAMAQGSHKAVSNAPAPVNPVGGRAAPAQETLRDELDDDKWFSIRRAQRLKKWKDNNISR